MKQDSPAHALNALGRAQKHGKEHEHGAVKNEGEKDNNGTYARPC